MSSLPRDVLRALTPVSGDPGVTAPLDIPLPLTDPWRAFAEAHGDGEVIAKGAALQVGGRVGMVVNLETLLGIRPLAPDVPVEAPRAFYSGVSGGGINSDTKQVGVNVFLGSQFGKPIYNLTFRLWMAAQRINAGSNPGYFQTDWRFKTATLAEPNGTWFNNGSALFYDIDSGDGATDVLAKSVITATPNLRQTAALVSVPMVSSTSLVNVYNDSGDEQRLDTLWMMAEPIVVPRMSSAGTNNLCVVLEDIPAGAVAGGNSWTYSYSISFEA